MKLAHALLFFAGSVVLTACARESAIATESPQADIGEVQAAPTMATKRIIVRFKDDPGFDSAALHRELGTKLIRQYSSVKGLEVVEIAPGQDIDNIIAQYQANVHVLYAEPDSIVSIQKK